MTLAQWTKCHFGAIWWHAVELPAPLLWYICRTILPVLHTGISIVHSNLWEMVGLKILSGSKNTGTCLKRHDRCLKSSASDYLHLEKWDFSFHLHISCLANCGPLQWLARVRLAMFILNIDTLNAQKWRWQTKMLPDVPDSSSVGVLFIPIMCGNTYCQLIQT